MFELPVDAHLELTRQDNGRVISAYVTVAPERPLRWRLEVSAQGAGGTSKVTQGGQLVGPRAGPVGTVTVSADSRGSVSLRIFDGEREIAVDTISLEDGPMEHR